jgi:chitodextrinase
VTKAELDYSRSLMAETNSILAGLDSTKIHDAVNWGHVGCTAVEKVKTFSGNAASIEWRVLIEEASPDAYEFRTLVAEELARRGYSGVAVVTAAASRAAAAVA